MKKLAGVPVISVGSVGLTSDFIGDRAAENARVASLEELVRRLERDEFDLVAVGRALLQDPYWLIKVREGRLDELRDYDRSAVGVLT